MYNRRQAITTLGAAGMFLPLRQSEVENKKIDFRDYVSLKAMEDDKSLKEGYIVRTAGYFSPGDGGCGQYIIKRSLPETRPDGGSCILLPSGLVAQLINADSINYRMFGAMSNGINDDGKQIKAAHAYANACRLPVINLSGEFWIRETNNISIQESVQWGSSIFHIDERHNSANDNRFTVTSRIPPLNVELEAEAKKSILNRIKPGVAIIPELAPYKNCLIFITDANDRIGYRAGNNASWSREEFFYVEEHGRIMGDIAWTFKDYTNLTAYSAETDYLIIDGGTFFMSGDSNSDDHNKYYSNGFYIQRSRTIIRNQWVGLGKDLSDMSLSPRNGFYTFVRAYDVTLENVRLMPWELFRDGKRVVQHGTYGIGGNRVLNSVFRNVTAEGSNAHWGVFGTNQFKNFRIERCQLNRVDIHFHCWNLTIVDSQLGSYGITLTGGGDLLIENTTCTGNKFVSFRGDYGSRWDGHIRIRHCRLKLLLPRNAAILDYSPNLSFDYKYPIGYGRTIQIEDMVIDASAVPDSQEPVWLMSVPQFDERSQSVFFPYDCMFKDIWVEGRAKGARLMILPDFSKLYTLSATDACTLENKPNVRMLFSNIALEKPDEKNLKAGRALHLQIKPRQDDTGEILFHPEINIEECNYLVADFGSQQANINIDKCILAKLTAGKEKLKGSLRLTFCRLMPIGYDGAEPAFQLETEQGVEFLCCVLHAPAKDGVANPAWLNQLGFIEINKSLRFNHLHTRLGTDIIEMLQNQGVKLSKEFIAKLQNNYELLSLL